MKYYEVDLKYRTPVEEVKEKPLLEWWKLIADFDLTDLEIVKEEYSTYEDVALFLAYTAFATGDYITERTSTFVEVEEVDL